MVSCRECSHLMLITEHGDWERRCTEKLETTYDDHECEKYSELMTSCCCCD